MDTNKLIGRVFSQETIGTKGENGLWTVKVNMTEKVTYPDGQERAESIDTECVDADFHVAHRIALHSGLSELARLVYDRGLDSLIDGMDFEREFEELLSDEGNTNQDTPTQ
jgi:hypothetical protein